MTRAAPSSATSRPIAIQTTTNTMIPMPYFSTAERLSRTVSSTVARSGARPAALAAPPLAAAPAAEPARPAVSPT